MKFVLTLVCCFFPLLACADILNDVGQDLISPATTPAKYVLYIGGAAALTAAIFEDSISDPIQAEATERRPLGHFATTMGNYAGPMLPNLVYSVGMAAYGLAADSSSANSRALVMTKASLYSIGISGAIKYIVQEPRPDGSDHFSFPSGHTTAAFSFASVVQAEHGWLVGSVAYAWATIVGYSRMNDNRHFLHDVLAGATVGASYGLGLYYRETGKKSGSEIASIQILPSDDLDGILALYRKNF